MMIRVFLAFSCAAPAMVLFGSGAAARTMHVLNSTPAASTVMDGRNQQYVVRFDGPVDHARSQLEILNGDRVIAVLYPLLDSAPDVLFASAPALPPSQYVLRWSVISISGEDESQGTIPFHVQ